MIEPTVGFVTAIIAAVASAMVLVIREVFNYFRQRNGSKESKNSMGAQSIPAGEATIRKIVMESIEAALKGRGSPSEILERMEKGQDALASYNLRVLDKLDKMSEGAVQNRNAIVEKLEAIVQELIRQQKRS